MKKRLLLGRDLCPKGPFEEEIEPRMDANGREIERDREARAEAQRRRGVGGVGGGRERGREMLDFEKRRRSVAVLEKTAEGL
jgi:hypothetical protein